ncbi:hypothetical protein ACIGXM_28605 [Kitasatospora sp. NPDC052896]|uniref:hypothetical protein n=1 Tax=Kitasatospora sp. NPDC052896 TaxID=3364061 RepID=UPI0037C54960
MADRRGMGLIVLLEVEEGFDADDLDSAFFRAVHAAASDPEVPEDPLPATLCGISTDPLVHSHYRAGFREPWYPPELEDRRCRGCEEALKRG